MAKAMDKHPRQRCLQLLCKQLRPCEQDVGEVLRKRVWETHVNVRLTVINNARLTLVSRKLGAGAKRQDAGSDVSWIITRSPHASGGENVPNPISWPARWALRETR